VVSRSALCDIFNDKNVKGGSENDNFCFDWLKCGSEKRCSLLEFRSLENQLVEETVLVAILGAKTFFFGDETVLVAILRWKML
jgi:hypothetical protein